MVRDRKMFFVRKYLFENIQYALRKSVYPADIYLFKVNNRNSRKRSEICH